MHQKRKQKQPITTTIMEKTYCYIVRFWIDDAKGNEKSNGMHVTDVFSTLEKAQGHLEFMRWAYKDKANARFLGETKIGGNHFEVPTLAITDEIGDTTFYEIDRRELK